MNLYKHNMEIILSCTQRGWHATHPSSTARHNKGSVCSTLDLQTKTDAGWFLSVYGYGAVPPVVVGRQCSQYLKCHVTTGQDEEGFWNVRTFWGEVLRFGEKLPTSMPTWRTHGNMRANRREKKPCMYNSGWVSLLSSVPTNSPKTKDSSFIHEL